MPVLYLYALADGLTNVSDLTGVQSEELVIVPLSTAAAVGGWVEAKPPLDAATLAAQDQVVRSLHARAAALLPMRFGTVVPDVEAAGRAVSLLEGALREQLAMVRGRDQMTIRVFVVADRPSPDPRTDSRPPDAPLLPHDRSSGRRYLEQRAAVRRPPSELATLASAVAPLQHGLYIEPGRDPSVVGSVYHLIDHGRSKEYVEAVTRAAAELTHVRVRLSGPSPAYAFASLRLR